MKTTLSVAELESQMAVELPDRDLMAPIIVLPGGLVNVVIDDVTIKVPIGIAANICDVNAAVLAAAIVDTGTATCTATADPDA